MCFPMEKELIKQMLIYFIKKMMKLKNYFEKLYKISLLEEIKEKIDRYIYIVYNILL